MKKIIIAILYVISIACIAKFVWLGVDLVQNYENAINPIARLMWIMSYDVKAIICVVIAMMIDRFEIRKVEG